MQIVQAFLSRNYIMSFGSWNYLRLNKTNVAVSSSHVTIVTLLRSSGRPTLDNLQDAFSAILFIFFLFETL